MKRNIDYLKENPGARLYLRHYNSRECWVIDKWQLTMGDKIVATIPETGYYTEQVQLVSIDAEVRDVDGNLVGTVHIPEPEEIIHMSITELARVIMTMKLDEVMFLYDCWDGNLSYTSVYGVTKVKLLGCTLVGVGKYGYDDSVSMIHLPDREDTLKRIERHLSTELDCGQDDMIYVELKKNNNEDR